MKTSYSDIIVGMSGGVDSAVTALLLLEAGYSVAGLFMKNWEEDDHPGQCAAAVDASDAQAVCDCLGIPLHRVNFSDLYWNEVFSHALQEYQRGRTPNPDILCNRQIKFRAFLQHAKTLGASKIATGHYAQIVPIADSYQLLKGVDPEKDQSYFLYTLGQTALSQSLFPVGSLTKSEVREKARQAKLPNHAKKDSTGICFIGERDFLSFLQRYLPRQPGYIVDDHGQVLGEHEGVIFYTLGQRKGLKIGGKAGSSGEPWFVIDKDIENNQLIVGQGHHHPKLYRDQILAEDLHWVVAPPPLPLTCEAKSRYRQAAQPCDLTVNKAGDRLDVRFHQPQWALTPGQSIVFYQGDLCLGGGIIQYF